MMNAPELILIAKDYNAQCSEACLIQFNQGEWTLGDERPSVLDAAVLAKGQNVGPSYTEAISAATGWPIETIVGFNTVMYLGYPAESATMQWDKVSYWRGVMMALFVYEKIKVRYI